VKGLDSGIAPLYLGEKGLNPEAYLDEASRSMSEGSAPNEESLPRARFVVLEERASGWTSTCKTMRATIMFYLFGISLSQVKEFRVAVKSVFENGQVDPQDPFAIEDSEVSDLDMLGFQDHPERHDIKYSEIMFTCLYSAARNLSWPASVS
jgi:hypothetical protein